MGSSFHRQGAAYRKERLVIFEGTCKSYVNATRAIYMQNLTCVEKLKQVVYI